jgi:hypothetical protein
MNELIAHRCWHLATRRTADPTLVELGDGNLAIPYAIMLYSFTNGTSWPGPVMHADEAPTMRNMNGIYAYKTPIHALRHDSRAPVTGEIAIYGKIVEAQYGYRAQHAAIRKLSLHAHRLDDLVRDENVAKQIAQLAHVLERRYKCDVTIDTSMRDLTGLERLVAAINNGSISPEDLVELAKKFGAP